MVLFFIILLKWSEFIHSYYQEKFEKLSYKMEELKHTCDKFDKMCGEFKKIYENANSMTSLYQSLNKKKSTRVTSSGKMTGINHEQQKCDAVCIEKKVSTLNRLLCDTRNDVMKIRHLMDLLNDSSNVASCFIKHKEQLILRRGAGEIGREITVQILAIECKIADQWRRSEEDIWNLL